MGFKPATYFRLLQMVPLRAARSEDLIAIHRVHRTAATGPDSAHRDDSTTRKWLSERTPESYREEMRSCHFIVAEKDSAIVGFGAIDLSKGEITSVYVDPAFTRRGIGSAIVRELETQASRAGLQEVTLQAAGGALDFYEKIGYLYVSPAHTRPSWAAMRKQV